MPRKPDRADPFNHVREQTLAHRARHGCGAWPYGNGPLLSVLAGAADARRILELGCALGYTALSFAHGAPDAEVETIDRDPEHVRLARETIAAAGLASRIRVHEGDFINVLDGLAPGYDVAFFDGFTPSPPILAALARLLRPRGLLISANLTHGGEATAYRATLFETGRWLTAFVDEGEETAVSIKL
jgi:predicted O-methyltransferase YrrM